MGSRATVTWHGRPAPLSAIAQKTTCTSVTTRASLTHSTGARLASSAIHGSYYPLANVSPR
eukprot:2585444-Pleurochrysis_carterae.AAC.1